MRSILRVSALILVLLALMMPLVAYAQVPCPDDLTVECLPDAPPYFVVTNREEEHLADRPGTGCQPFILANPDCKDCATDAACLAIDINADVCEAVMAPRGLPAGDVYEMCCACAVDPTGDWVYRVWYFDGSTCTLESEGWEEGLPPGTGIDLPAPLIIGGAVVLGAGLLAAGLLVRRRSMQVA
ncbi:MAG: hypothetical protein PVI67_12275 [Anaerolineae bacterium]